MVDPPKEDLTTDAEYHQYTTSPYILMVKLYWGLLNTFLTAAGRTVLVAMASLTFDFGSYENHTHRTYTKRLAKLFPLKML